MRELIIKLMNKLRYIKNNKKSMSKLYWSKIFQSKIRKDKFREYLMQLKVNLRKRILTWLLLRIIHKSSKKTVRMLKNHKGELKLVKKMRLFLKIIINKR